MVVIHRFDCSCLMPELTTEKSARETEKLWVVVVLESFKFQALGTYWNPGFELRIHWFFFSVLLGRASIVSLFVCIGQDQYFARNCLPTILLFLLALHLYLLINGRLFLFPWLQMTKTSPLVASHPCHRPTHCSESKELCSVTFVSPTQSGLNCPDNLRHPVSPSQDTRYGLGSRLTTQQHDSHKYTPRPGSNRCRCCCCSSFASWRC